MGYDIFAEITAETQDKIEHIRNGQYGDFIINDVHSRLKLLTGALPYQEKVNKEKISDMAKAAHKRIVYECKLYNTLVASELERMRVLDIKTPHIVIDSFPPFSFYLQFTFKLAKPYLSKDDDVFYPCENPIRKDKVFKVPMVAASTWKGNLRWTARQIKGLNTAKPDTPDTPEIIRLFGNEKGQEMVQEKEFKKGRLNFYPTFFNQIGIEVINPHDRKTKAGTNPIYIESVPIKASGTFSLLYVPFDLMGKQEDEIKEQVKKDMEIISESLITMMLEYGFSAKKGSGFGVVDKNISGTFEMSRCHVETKFSGFDGLKKLMDRVKEVMERGHGI